MVFIILSPWGESKLSGKFSNLFITDNDYSLINKANQEISDSLKEIASDTLNQVLLVASKHMKCNYNRADN